MAADYYYADAENGDHVDDPSEDALLMLIDELNHDDNTFVTINPADDDPARYASVSPLDDDTYEVERHIADDLTIWLAGRHNPDRPA